MDTHGYLDTILSLLPSITDHHSPADRLYGFLKQVARDEVISLFSAENDAPRHFGEFGEIEFPFFSMGAVDSRNLFDIDELIIFSFYLTNRSRYRHAADIGANIGLHSILLSRCGFDVRCFEPDPTHFQVLRKNLEANHCGNVEPSNCAVSAEAGEMQFVRVLGNTTGSHLAGSKANPYGTLERFPVRVESIVKIIEWADFIKLDAEGHEAPIIAATTKDQWKKTDAMIEVENAENARTLFTHFTSLGVNMFSQKTGWRQCGALADLPTTYKEGMMFVTCKNEMPWR